MNGGPPGDLLLEVSFRRHPRFRVDGADLIVELPVAPWEAALGAVAPVGGAEAHRGLCRDLRGVACGTGALRAFL